MDPRQELRDTILVVGDDSRVGFILGNGRGVVEERMRDDKAELQCQSSWNHGSSSYASNKRHSLRR